jgi:hypothetical protein
MAAPRRLRIIHAALGHSAARVHAYCSMPDGEAAFGPDGRAMAEILARLQRELGLPFADDYLPHIGNFEVLTLADWGERLPPFLIEIVAAPAPDQTVPEPARHGRSPNTRFRSRQTLRSRRHPRDQRDSGGRQEFPRLYAGFSTCRQTHRSKSSGGARRCTDFCTMLRIFTGASMVH